MKMKYPNNATSADNSLGHTNSEGEFPIGITNNWHGGIHVRGNNKIVCVADGHIVAYRMVEEYPIIEEKNAEGEDVEVKYSNVFVLVQHKYKSPKGQELIFYSLYNQLQAKNEYPESTNEIPSFLANSKAVTGNGNKVNKGLELFIGNKKNRIPESCILLPKGLPVTIEDNKFFSTPKGDTSEGRAFDLGKYVTVSCAIQGTPYSGQIYCIGNYLTPAFNEAKIKEINLTDKPTARINNDGDPASSSKHTIYEGVFIYEDSGQTKLIDVLPKDLALTIKSDKNSKPLQVTLTYNNREITGYISNDKASVVSKQEWKPGNDIKLDEIVSCNIPIKAGDLIGYTGVCQLNGRSNAAHVEIFTDAEKGNLEDFLGNKKEDNITNGVVSKPFVKLPKTLSRGFKYQLLYDTQIEVKETSGNYHKIKIGRVYKTVDKSELGEYNTTSQSYAVKSGSTLFNELLCSWESIKLEENPNKVKTNVDGTKPRNISYGYPISGKEFWIEKKHVVEISANPITTFVSNSPKSHVLHLPNMLVVKTFELFHECPSADTTLQKVEGEVIVSLSDCKIIQAQNGKVGYCYVDTEYTGADNAIHRCKGYVALDDKAELFPAHNWSKFGFRLFDDHDESDEYIFDLASSKYVDELWKVFDPEEKLERSVVDYIRGLHTPRVIEKLSKLVCYHRSEWGYDDPATWLKLEEEIRQYYKVKYIDKAENSEVKQKLEEAMEARVVEIKEKVEKMSFWKTVISAASPATSSPDTVATSTLATATDAPSANAEVASPQEQTTIPAVVPDGEVTASATQSASVAPAETPAANAATSAPAVATSPAQATATEEKKEDIAPLPKTPYFYFFNPIAFIKQMKLVNQHKCVCKEYNLIWGNKVPCVFRKKVVEISKELWADNYLNMANNLMAVFAWESGGSFKAGVPNQANSGGTGLIQFMPATAKSLLGKEITIEYTNDFWGKKLKRVKEFAEMTEIKQLDYVKKYFEPLKNKKVEFVDFYLQVLFPASSLKENHIVFAKSLDKITTRLTEKESLRTLRVTAYSQNSGLDSNNDGVIWKDEIKEKVQKYVTQGESNRATSFECNNASTVSETVIQETTKEGYDIDKAVKTIDSNAQSSPVGYCAKYVRLAIEAGGLSTEGRPGSATNYDTFLPKLGFATVDSANYVPKKGDIVVFKAFQGAKKYHQHGHIQMYNGAKWVSDFLQRDFWAGPDYRTHKPEYIIFRWE